MLTFDFDQAERCLPSKPFLKILFYFLTVVFFVGPVRCGATARGPIGLRGVYVPVVVSDGWRLPFDDVVDWSRLGFRAREVDAPDVVASLAAVPTALACALGARGEAVASLLGRFDVVVELLLESLRRHVGYSVAEVNGRAIVDAPRERRAGPRRVAAAVSGG